MRFINEHYQDLADGSGVSVDTIRQTMPKLKKAGFVKSIGLGSYMIAPKTIRPGQRWQGAVLVELWDEI